MKTWFAIAPCCHLSAGTRRVARSSPIATPAAHFDLRVRTQPRIGFAEDLVASDAHGSTVGQADPFHPAIRLNQELRGPRDICAFRTAADVQKIIRADNLLAGVGKQGEGHAGLLCQPAAGFSRIHADRHDVNVAPMELTQLGLEAPQLGDAVRSPVAPIEN